MIDVVKLKKAVLPWVIRICAALFILALPAAPFASRGNSRNDATNDYKAAEFEEKVTPADGYEELNYKPEPTDYTEDFSKIPLAEDETGDGASETADTSEIAQTSQSPSSGLNGYHIRTYSNGDKYAGNFENGKREGHGTYTWASGIIYTGEFTDGEPTGNGVYTYPGESTAEPPPDQTRPPQETELPKDDFMQLMFDSAIEIPENRGKIEPPPEGRSTELQYAAVPLSDVIPEPFGYFKDIIFLGDSVTIGFDMFRARIKFNGEAVLRDVTVIASGSYGVYKSSEAISDSSIHPLFGGKQTLPEDIIAQKEAKYVMICLGLNDVAVLSSESYISYYSYLIERIKAKSPDKTVVIMSVTPLVYGGQKTRLNNKNIMDLNNALIQLAQEKNIPFIDYAAAIRDSQNHLYDEFSSDAYCHLTVPAYDRIVEYLLYHPLRD